MNPKLDDDLRRLHEQFNADHSAGRQRLLAALATQMPEGLRAGRILQSAGRRLGGIAAAAAILLAAYVVFFSNGTQNIAWAAVLHQLSRISSVAWRQEAIVSTEGFADDDAFTGPWNRGYLKAPHLFRLEQWPATSSQPTADTPLPITIRIWRTEPGQGVHIDLHPTEKRAIRRIVRTNREPNLLRNVPGETWSKLRALRDHDVRELGQTRWDGVPTVGFEAPFTAFEPDAPDPDGTIRVWVHEQTAVPVRLELRNRVGDQYFTTLITAIEWNVSLPDELFEVPDEGDWQVEERVIQEHVYPYPGARLKPGVTLRITSPTGDVILTEQHVAAVTMSSTEGNDEPRISLHVGVTPEGEQRLADYSAAHIGEIVTITLNGEVVGQPRILAPLSKAFRIDVPKLGPPLDELVEPITESEPDGDG